MSDPTRIIAVIDRGDYAPPVQVEIGGGVVTLRAQQISRGVVGERVSFHADALSPLIRALCKVAEERGEINKAEWQGGSDPHLSDGDKGYWVPISWTEEDWPAEYFGRRDPMWNCQACRVWNDRSLEKCPCGWVPEESDE